MPDEEHKKPEILQDVDPSNLGQLSPGYTPYNAELQSWNRGRSLGGGGGSYQTGRSSSLPEFTALESEDLSAAAKEYAGYLNQNELSSVMNYEKGEQLQSTENEPTTPVDYQHDRQQQEQLQEVEKEQKQQEDKDHER